MNEIKEFNRRDFMRGAGALAFAGAAYAAVGGPEEGTLWQLNPNKCTQCGQCTTHCVLNPSAVKCLNQFNICGYCDLCFGYLQPGSREKSSGAEDQLCPTSAIVRKYIEDPYYEYMIDEDRCIGCAKCVDACLMFGNASFYLQIRQDLCINCNECSIAWACPSDAFSKVPVSQPYMYLTGGTDAIE
ncbi:MAG: 4Fe-4S binding protein [Candidatus Hydrogenedentes bacterium]|jgi:electron transport complex protein RnfB|nr:4Fe-4S binding protein [Candidatus Hydrogenedentota bacterium]